MTFLIITTIILFLFSVTAVIVVLNLLKKVEIYEEDITLKDGYIRDIHTYIQEGDKILDVPLLRGAFQADDEVGDYFKKMREIQFKLNTYTQNYIDNTK